MTKAEDLARIEGYRDLQDLCEDYVFDSICPAICMNEGCEYTTKMEPDQDRGYCEVCGTNSLKSGLMILGVI